MAAGAKRFLNSMFGEDVKNVFLQHKSLLNTQILDSIYKGKLDENRYPVCEVGGHNSGINRGGRIDTLIIFIVGGVTYEEAREAANFWNQEPLSKQQQIHQMAGQALGTLNGLPTNQPRAFDILLGGTYIHNSKTFLADISQLGNEGNYGKMGKLEIM